MGPRRLQSRGGLSAPTRFVSCELLRAASGSERRGSCADGDFAAAAGDFCPRRFLTRILHTDNRQNTALAYQVDAVHRTLGDSTSVETDRICKGPCFALLFAPLSWARRVGTQVPYAPTVSIYLLTQSAEAPKLEGSKSPSPGQEIEFSQRPTCKVGRLYFIPFRFIFAKHYFRELGRWFFGRKQNFRKVNNRDVSDL